MEEENEKNIEICLNNVRVASRSLSQALQVKTIRSIITQGK